MTSLNRGQFFWLMIDTLIGTKLEQTQEFTDDGRRIPVTKIQAGPCYVTSVIDAINAPAYQLGFGQTKRATKAQTGHTKKAGIETNPRFFREVRVSELDESIKPGDKISVSDIFSVGDRVRVTATSKGKGFASAIKRHGFAGGPRTHGQSDRERAPGSIGQTTTPGRVYRGKRMAGRMGGERVTVRGLTVVSVDQENNIIVVKGLIPGAKQGMVLIKRESPSQIVQTSTE